MKVLGLDPGLRVTGWGVVELRANRIRHLANGTCRSEGSALADRLLSLHRQLTEIVARTAPDTAAVEKVFVNADSSGSLKLGQARAIALLVPAQAGIEVQEYAPNAVKKAVVGVGHADKSQVERMVSMQLPGTDILGPDASDALAVALTHAFLGRQTWNLEKALAKAEA